MTAQKRSRNYSKSGFYTAKKALKEYGQRAIDGRSAIGKALSQWRDELVNDLGGVGAISKQQSVIIDLAMRTHLLLESIDSWLLQQKSLINLRKRALLPVVRERQQLADSLAKYMTTLGLERKAKPVPTLAEYIESRSSQDGDGDGTEDAGQEPESEEPPAVEGEAS